MANTFPKGASALSTIEEYNSDTTRHSCSFVLAITSLPVRKSNSRKSAIMTWKQLTFSKYVVWAYVLVVMLLAVLPLNLGGSLNNIMLRYE
jgi:hypothetical protein